MRSHPATGALGVSGTLVILFWNLEVEIFLEVDGEAGRGSYSSMFVLLCGYLWGSCGRHDLG